LLGGVGWRGRRGGTGLARGQGRIAPVERVLAESWARRL